MAEKPAMTPRDPSGAAVYATEALAQLPRLLSLLDREQHSQSYGSFDRHHWGWKFRDFPLGMLQSGAYPLALVWRHALPGNPYQDKARLLAWITGTLERTLSRQHANGSFDAFSPNEQDPGTTLGVIHGVAETFRLVRESLSADVQARVLDALRNACTFALDREENHAFVSNHWALFAVAFLDAYELLGDTRFQDRAEAIIDRILHHQSADGWYLEYEGPDPGYESLGLFHLAIYWQRTGARRVLDSLRRSIDCYAHFVHPDGSVGGVYGSRHTALYFPGGFEILASEIPMAASVARFMRTRLARRNVVTPAAADVENLPPLLYSYLEACRTTAAPTASLPALPCETLDGVRHFEEADLFVAGTPRYYAVLNAAKGGVCRVFDKHTHALAYEDAGYLVSTGRHRWASQFTGLGHAAAVADAHTVACSTSLAAVRQEIPTPLKFLVLRVLNLTLFRSLTLGNWLRRLIIARLITRKQRGPFRLHRTVTFGEDTLRFHDRLEGKSPHPVEAVARPRSFTAIHMGSAKYFHPSELEPVVRVPLNDMAQDLRERGVAECTFALHFSATSGPALLPDADEATRPNPLAGATAP